MNIAAFVIWGLIAIYVTIKFAQSIRLVPTQKAHIVERLGRYNVTLGAGFHILIPFIDKVVQIKDLREEAIEVPPQECFTKDNVKVLVDGVIYMSVENAETATYGVTDHRYAAVKLAQTTTRSVIGTLELDQTFEERETISGRVVSVLGEVSEAWGIRVHRYELKNIDPPETVRDSMERQMSAERERRALLAKAQGDKQSMINKSEAQKMELINRSEGERQKLINVAEGKASEILSVAKATAHSIETLGAAIVQQGGLEAIRLQQSQALIDTLGQLGKPTTSIVLPADMMQMSKLLDSFGLGMETDKDEATRKPPVTRGAPPIQYAASNKPPLPPRKVTRGAYVDKNALVESIQEDFDDKTSEISTFDPSQFE